MRTEFGSKVKLAAYKRCLINDKPHCELCDKLILGVCEYDHIKADGLKGDATLQNCMVLCGSCHRTKTHGHDRPIMQKADNQMKAQAGIKSASRPMPGSRNSGWKKRMDGSVVRR